MSTNNWFMDQARLGNVYSTSPAAEGVFTVIHATSTGLSLENPFGSGKDLIVKSAKFVSTLVTTIGEVGLAVNPTVSTVISGTATAAVIHNGRNTGSDANVGVALAWTIAVLPSTPVWMELQGTGIITNNLGGFQALSFEPDGWCIVPPGSYLTWASLTVVRTGVASFVWAEVDCLA